MKIDFDSLPLHEVVGLRGGEGKALIRQVEDADNRIMRITLSPGASIGFHRHDTSSEMVYLLSGNGVFVKEEGEEAVTAGDCHYCPKGQAHSLKNTGETDLTILAIVPEHHPV